jgi:hypothetical protein
MVSAPTIALMASSVASVIVNKRSSIELSGIIFKSGIPEIRAASRFAEENAMKISRELWADAARVLDAT